MLDTDSEYIAHDCDYYPADIMERDELWKPTFNALYIAGMLGLRK
jgi:hypothetical protein